MLSILGAALSAQEYYADAENYIKRVLAIRESKLEKKHLDVATTLNNLAVVYNFQGKAADAEPVLHRVLVIMEEKLGTQHQKTVQNLHNLAVVYKSLGRQNLAISLLERTLKTKEAALGRDHIDVSYTTGVLANLYASQKRHKEAEIFYKRSLNITEGHLGKDHPYVAKVLNNLAGFFVDQGRYSEAEPFYRRSLAILEAKFGREHPLLSHSLNGLAHAYIMQGSYDTALPIINKLNAWRLSHPTWQLTHPMIILPGLYGARSQNLISKEHAFVAAYNPLQYALSSSSAEAVKKLALRYAAGSGELPKLIRRTQDLEQEFKAFDKILMAEISKPSNQRSETKEKNLRKRIDEIRAERKSISFQVERDFPEYVALSNPKPLTLNETQELLTDDEAVVAFQIFEDNSYAFVVTKDDGYWTEIPAKAKDISALVKRLRKQMENQDTGQYDADAAYELYKALFAPIADKLKGKARLSILPHGPLTSLPLGMLITSDPSGKSLKDQDYLIKSHAITIIPSIYALKTMRATKAAAAPKKMIAFADPVFGGSEGKLTRIRSLSSFYKGTEINIKALSKALPQLPGTRAEVGRIARFLNVPTSDIKLGLDATETAVKRAALDQYRIVYFATHGLVAGDLKQFAKAKAEPSLALTIPSTPSNLDNGLLEASEVAMLKLNAEWAVLSACNTAAGDGENAEALSGLARAFLYAGAKSLVVSHWAVADDATANLMSALFKIADENPQLTHGQAMQRAKLKMLSEAKTDEEAHPFYWAPFIVVGEGLPNQ